jgi:hypothetical protein
MGPVVLFTYPAYLDLFLRNPCHLYPVKLDLDYSRDVRVPGLIVQNNKRVRKKNSISLLTYHSHTSVMSPNHR